MTEPSTAVAPASEQAGSQGETAVGTTQAASKVEIKPIPVRAPKPAPVDLGFDTNKDSEEGGFLGRDARGRFARNQSLLDRVEKEMFGPSGNEAEESEEGAEGAEPAKTKVAVPAVPPGEKPVSTGEFLFAGRKFKDQSEAEQRHKSLEGQFKPLEQRASRAEQERDEGYRRAHGWAEYARQLEAKLQAQTGAPAGGGQAGAQPGRTGVAPASKPGAMPSVDDVLSNIDADAFEQVLVQGGAAQAGKFLASEILSAVSEKLLVPMQQHYESQLAPFQDAEAGREMADTLSKQLQQMASLKGADGQPAFPELLDDGSTMQEVGALWESYGLPVEMALTGSGMITAIGLYRLMKGFSQTAEQLETPAVQETATRQQPAAALAASLPQDPGRGVPPNNGRATGSAFEQAFMNRLDEVPLKHADLGFTPRPGWRG